MKYIILGICILILFLIVAYFMVSKKKFDKDVQEMIASAKRKLDGVVAEAIEKRKALIKYLEEKTKNKDSVIEFGTEGLFHVPIILESGESGIELEEGMILQLRLDADNQKDICRVEILYADVVITVVPEVYSERIYKALSDGQKLITIVTNNEEGHLPYRIKIYPIDDQDLLTISEKFGLSFSSVQSYTAYSR